MKKSCEPALSLRNDPEVCSEIFKTVIPIINAAEKAPSYSVSEVRSLAEIYTHQTIPQIHRGQHTPAACRSNISTLVAMAWRAEHWSKEDYSPALRLNDISFARFWTCLEPITPSFIFISPFWSCNVSYACTSVVSICT